jgi:hypothetical protein
MNNMAEFEERYGEDEITCPYCRLEIGDSWELTSDSDDCYECPHCNKNFSWERRTEVTYTSTPDCKLNKEEHKFSEWEDLVHKDNEVFTARRECTVCEKTEYKRKCDD